MNVEGFILVVACHSPQRFAFGVSYNSFFPLMTMVWTPMWYRWQTRITPYKTDNRVTVKPTEKKKKENNEEFYVAVTFLPTTHPVRQYLIKTFYNPKAIPIKP